MNQEPHAGHDVNRWGVPLRYAVALARLDSELRDCFLAGQLDGEGEAFLVSTLERNHSTWGLRIRRLLSRFLSDFSANALLGMYPVFLLSTPQAQALLEALHPNGSSERRLLDVGPGSGDVTTRLTPLVQSVDCTETSYFMARRLRRRGFNCWLGPVGEGNAGDPLARSPGYDVICLFNVIDRVARPRRLLEALVAHLPPEGTLLLSLPLPYDPFFYAGAVTHAPEERLRIDAEDWEDALGQLWRRELQPLGLVPGAVMRVPYLSGGDADHAAYVLDSAVLALRKVVDR